MNAETRALGPGSQHLTDDRDRDDRTPLVSVNDTGDRCGFCDTQLAHPGCICGRCYRELVAQLRRRRDAALRSVPLDDGRRDPADLVEAS